MLDDDPGKREARIGSVSVRGALAEVAGPRGSHGATHVTVSLPGATAAERRPVIALALARTTGLPVLTVTLASGLQDGRGPHRALLGIEPEDFSAEPVHLDQAGNAELISDKMVLVTGAALEWPGFSDRPD